MPSIFSKEGTTEARKAFQYIYAKNRTSWNMSLVIATCAAGYYGYNSIIAHKPTTSEYLKNKKSLSTRNKRHKTAVNKKFIHDLRKLLKIAVPNLWCKEVFYMFILAILLVIRTILSIKIADVNGTIVKSIVKRQFWRFLLRIATLGSIAIPASVINSALTFFTAKLALQFRKRLVHHFHNLYLSPMMYYKVTNIDTRISNPDQALTSTITAWGVSLAELYSNLTKPLLDIVLFSKKLADLMGWEGPGLVLGYYFFSGIVIRLISPPFGTLQAISSNMEGNFRSMHHRLIIHSEEIAFYGGHNKEKKLLNDHFKSLYDHLCFVLEKKFGMGAFNGFLKKYGSVMCGYTVLGLPVFGSKSTNYVNKTASEITQDYIRNSSLLINLSKAIGRIVTSYEDVQKLAGHTKLVSKMNTVLKELNDGWNYERTKVNVNELKELDLSPGKGKRLISNDIKFSNLSVVTPNGDILVHNINFTLKHGENLMITGPNGVGKSSLFRLLGELWPLWNGELSCPKQSDFFYIPQKPYLCKGTFRDQLIYPDTVKQMHQKNFTDDKLVELLDYVKLVPLLKKQTDGWDTVSDWFDVLSGGEKQRVAMARVFYHMPKFAILDECTSAVSLDVEASMYKLCKSKGITLITISHRPSVWEHHSKRLHLNGKGNIKEYDYGDMVLPKNYKSMHA